MKQLITPLLLVAWVLLQHLGASAHTSSVFTEQEALEVIGTPGAPIAARIAAHLVVAEELAPFDPVEGIKHARIADHLQLQLPEAEPSGRVELAKLTCYLHMGRMDSVEAITQGCRTRFPDGFREECLNPRMHMVQAAYYMAIGDLRRAEEHARAAQQPIIKNDTIAWKAWMALGAIHYRRGELVEAVNIAITSHWRYWAYADSLEMAYCHNLAGLVLLSLAYEESALEEFEKAINSVWSRGSQSLLMAKFMLNKAVALKHMGNYKEADALFNRLEAVFRRHQAAYWVTACLNNRGEIASKQRDFPEAIRWYHEALASLSPADSSSTRVLIEANIRENVVYLMHADWYERGVVIVQDQVIQVNGVHYQLDECVRFCTAVRDLLLIGKYREFPNELSNCLAMAYEMIGDSAKAEQELNKKRKLDYPSEVASEVLRRVQVWRTQVLELDESQARRKEFTEFLGWGLVAIPLILATLYFVGRHPGTFVVKALFFLSTAFTATWVEIIVDHWLRTLAGNEVGVYLFMLVAVGVIVIGIHIWGHRRFDAFLMKRVRARELKRKNSEQPKPVVPAVRLKRVPPLPSRRGNTANRKRRRKSKSPPSDGQPPQSGQPDEPPQGGGTEDAG
jgi:tetratricopeptide (TPR) repeat protein